MMAGLGVGGVAVGMFHLITHAFFKALLFMGAGSVIHGATRSRTFAAWAACKIDMPSTFVDLCRRHAGALRISAVLLRLLEQGRHSRSGAALDA